MSEVRSSLRPTLACAALAALLAVFLAAVVTLALPGCAGHTAPTSSAGAGDAHAEVDTAFQLAGLSASLAQAAAVADGSAEGCLAAAIAYGGLQLAHTVYHGALGEGGAWVLDVDASACLPLGLPTVPAPDADVDARIRTALRLVADALGVVDTLVDDDVLAQVAAVLDQVASTAYPAVVEAFAAEAAAPDGRVTVTLLPVAPGTTPVLGVLPTSPTPTPRLGMRAPDPE